MRQTLDMRESSSSGARLSAPAPLGAPRRAVTAALASLPAGSLAEPTRSKAPVSPEPTRYVQVKLDADDVGPASPRPAPVRLTDAGSTGSLLDNVTVTSSSARAGRPAGMIDRFRTGPLRSSVTGGAVANAVLPASSCASTVTGNEPSIAAAAEGDSADEPGGEQHVTGQELCEAIRQYALQQYGYMAKCVLNHWGVTGTGDFGEIVFNLIDIGQMRKTEHDRREDFENVFNFDTDLARGFQITLPRGSEGRR